MSRKEEFHAGTGKALTPPTRDIFAEEERAPSTSRMGVEQDSPDIGTPGSDLPRGTGTGTVQDLNEDGNGTTVIRGLPNAPVAKGAVKTPGGPAVPGVKVQPAEKLVEGPKPTPASKRKDNETPRLAPVIEGGEMTGVQPVEREEVDKAERAAAIRAAANRGPRGLRTTDLRLGELADADPTIHAAFSKHIQNWRQRTRKGMEAPAGQTNAAEVVGRKLADKGESNVIDHPAFRNDVTYQRVADAISDHVGLVQDHKNKDKDGNPTVRKINAEDLADFASFHRHIFGGPQHVNDVSPEGEPVHYRVDPAAFSMFNLVGKHQRRDKATRQAMPQIQGQDAYHWMVGAIRNHIDSDATRIRRGIRLDARRERREDAALGAKLDNRGPEAIIADNTRYGESTRATTVKQGAPKEMVEPQNGPQQITGTDEEGNPTLSRVEGWKKPKTFTPVESTSKAVSIKGLPVGTKIHHPVHGVGVITELGDDHSRVDFGDLHAVDRSPQTRKIFHAIDRVTPLS